MDTETESDARKEKLAEEAEDRIRRGAHWSDWMYVADGFAVGRAKAMRAAGTNQPYGKAYTRAFGEWMKERPWAREERIDKGTRSNLLWAADHRSEIEAWRETLTQGERAKMNHPTTLKRRFEAAHRITAIDPTAPKKETSREALVRENEDLWAKVKKLERQVEAGDGSLFDLRRDSVEAIIDTIAGNVPLGRFESLQRAMTKKLSALKTLDKAKLAKAG
jgi:hypothetical protein